MLTTVLRILLGLAIVAQVTLAIVLWPELPERIPQHFDAYGRPDAFGAPDAEWFVISGLLAIIGAICGFGLPPLVARLVRANSALLNVPDRERFRALPEALRLRAVAGLAPWLLAIACELQVLVLFLLDGTWRVATGRWSDLPPPLLYGMLVLILASAVGLAVHNVRAVRCAIAAGHAATAAAGARDRPR